MKIEIYSDVACPWCYIGKRRFESALAAFPGADAISVSYRPFQLNPGAPATAVPLLEALARKFGPQAEAMTGRVSAAAQQEGITMSWDKALSVNTLGAHRLMWLAERDGAPQVQAAVAEGLFDAYFTQGADLGDMEVLAEIGAAAGLDRDRVHEALATGEGVDEVRAEIEKARELGITAVPTFVFDGKNAVQGAQPPAVLLQMLEAVAAR